QNTIFHHRPKRSPMAGAGNGDSIGRKRLTRRKPCQAICRNGRGNPRVQETSTTELHGKSPTFKVNAGDQTLLRGKPVKACFERSSGYEPPICWLFGTRGPFWNILRYITCKPFDFRQGLAKEFVHPENLIDKSGHMPWKCATHVCPDTTGQASV